MLNTQYIVKSKTFTACTWSFRIGFKFRKKI